MRGGWLVLLLSLHQAAFSHGLSTSGQLYVFGKIAKTGEAVAINEPHAPFLGSDTFPVMDFAAGDNMAVALDANGVAMRFDDITPSSSLTSHVPAPDGRHWCQVCRGSIHTVAVTCDGDAFTWGLRRPPSLPDDPPLPANMPVPLDVGGERVLQISCGQNHTLLLSEERHVYSFGVTSNGRLGIGEMHGDMAYIEAPSAVRLDTMVGDRVCSIEAGGTSSFAITESGKMFAWGGNSVGQLGLGEVSSYEASPVLIESDPEFKACEVAAGQDFVLGYDDKGDVFSWGSGSPNVTRFGLAPATQVVMSILESRTVQVAAGEFHAAMLQDDGTVLTYGYNRFGQLGVVIGADMPTELDPEFEPESPIWTLSPKAVEELAGKNITSVFAAGNYTAALANVLTAHNCPCARGGRQPRQFFPWNPSFGPEGPPFREKNPKIPPVQPIRPPSSVFEPVSPYVGKKRIEASPPLPGELAAHIAPTEMTEFNSVPMMDSFDTQPLELPKRPATFYFYPEGSNDAKVWEEGAEKGVEQKLFGRHMNSDGYFYGDFDEEVSAENYRRQAVMGTAGNELMPEKGSDGPAGHQAAGTENVGNVLSFSLQDAKTTETGDEAMLKSTFSAVRELKDTHPPVDFAKMHVAVPEEKLELDGSELVQESAREAVGSALQPHMLD